MPRYTTVTPTYTPISFQEMIAPYAMYKEEYDKQNTALSDLGVLADNVSGLIDPNKDAELAGVMQQYQQDFNNTIDTFASTGRLDTVRKSLLDLKKRYASELLPIQTAAQDRAAAIKAYDDRVAADHSYIGIDPRTHNIKDYLNGNSPNEWSGRGSELEKDAQEQASALSSRTFRQGYKGGYRYNFTGFDEPTAQRLIQASQDDGLLAMLPENEQAQALQIREIFKNTSGTFSIDNFGKDSENYNRAYKAIYDGIYKGLIGKYSETAIPTVSSSANRGGGNNNIKPIAPAGFSTITVANPDFNKGIAKSIKRNGTTPESSGINWEEYADLFNEDGSLKSEEQLLVQYPAITQRAKNIDLVRQDNRNRQQRTSTWAANARKSVSDWLTEKEMPNSGLIQLPANLGIGVASGVAHLGNSIIGGIKHNKVSISPEGSNPQLDAETTEYNNLTSKRKELLKLYKTYGLDPANASVQDLEDKMVSTFAEGSLPIGAHPLKSATRDAAEDYLSLTGYSGQVVSPTNKGFQTVTDKKNSTYQFNSKTDRLNGIIFSPKDGKFVYQFTKNSKDSSKDPSNVYTAYDGSLDSLMDEQNVLSIFAEMMSTNPRTSDSEINNDILQQVVKDNLAGNNSGVLTFAYNALNTVLEDGRYTVDPRLLVLLNNLVDESGKFRPYSQGDYTTTANTYLNVIKDLYEDYVNTTLLSNYPEQE